MFDIIYGSYKLQYITYIKVFNKLVENQRKEKEHMEIILLLIMILLYFVILYFINKQRAISLISELVKYAEIYIKGGDLKTICKTSHL